MGDLFFWTEAVIRIIGYWVSSKEPPMPTTLTQTRRSTSARLRGLELPDAFAAATVAASAAGKGSRADRRRNVSKALRVVGGGR